MLAGDRRISHVPFKKLLIGAFALMFLFRIGLDGWIEYKNESDSRQTVDPTVCVVKLVKP